eukprot:5821207-Amphidinium_carterae.1
MLLESGARTPRQSASGDLGEGKAGSVAKLKCGHGEDRAQGPQRISAGTQIVSPRWPVSSSAAGS